MCVYLHKYTQYTHIYYVNTNFVWMRLIVINQFDITSVCVCVCVDQFSIDKVKICNSDHFVKWQHVSSSYTITKPWYRHSFIWTYME